MSRGDSGGAGTLDGGMRDSSLESSNYLQNVKVFDNTNNAHKNRFLKSSNKKQLYGRDLSGGGSLETISKNSLRDNSLMGINNGMPEYK